MAAVAQSGLVNTFTIVNKDTPESIHEITKIFNHVLVPLYGSQEKAIGQIALAKDRVTYLLSNGEAPVGVLVFKNTLSQEFEKDGIKDSIEIKSLFVINAEVNSGKGFGSILFNKLIEESEKMNLHHKGFHVTVSEDKPESLAFFNKKGFSVVSKWKGKYFPEKTEYLLSLPLSEKKI